MPEQPPIDQRESAAMQIISPPYPQTVEKAYQAIRTEGGYQVITDVGTRYVVISAGQRPTGGYSLYIDRVEREKGKTIVYVGEKKPAPTAMTTQALTYPTIVVALPDNDENIDVVFLTGQ